MVKLSICAIFSLLLLSACTQQSVIPSPTISPTPVALITLPPVQSPTAIPKGTRRTKAKPTAKPTVKATVTPTTNTTNTNHTTNSQTNAPATTAPATSAPTATPTPRPAFILSSTNITATLDKATPHYADLMFAPGFTVTANDTLEFQFKNWNPQGYDVFYPGSWGVMGANTSFDVRTSLEDFTPNGTYTGNVIFSYRAENGSWQDGPTISYTVTVVDSR